MSENRQKLQMTPAWAGRLISDESVLFLMMVYTVTVFFEDSMIYMAVPYAGRIMKLCRYVFYLAALCNLLRRLIHGGKICLKHILIVAVSLLTYLSGHDQYVLILCLLMFAMSHMDLRKAARYYCFGALIAFAVLVLLAGTGVIENVQYARASESTRWSLGFIYPTLASTCLFLILLTAMYWKKAKLSWLMIAVETVLTIFTYVLTDSRTGLVLCLLVIIAEVFCRLKEFPAGILDIPAVRIFLIALPWILVVFWAIAVYGYSQKFGWTVLLNKALSGRLGYSLKALRNYALCPFGTKIRWVGWGSVATGQAEWAVRRTYNYVDNGYLKGAFDYGYVYMAGFLYLYSRAISSGIQKKNVLLVYILCVILLWAVIEPEFLEIGKNIFLIAIAKEAAVPEGRCFSMMKPKEEPREVI